MDEIEYEEKWQSYLSNLFTRLGAPIFFVDDIGLPQLFAYPYCATCKHWFPIHRDGLDKIAISEREYIELAMNGGITKSVKIR